MAPPEAFSSESSESSRKRLQAASTNEICPSTAATRGIRPSTTISDNDHRGRPQRRETDRNTDAEPRHDEPERTCDGNALAAGAGEADNPAPVVDDTPEELTETVPELVVAVDAWVAWAARPTNTPASATAPPPSQAVRSDSRRRPWSRAEGVDIPPINRKKLNLG